MSWSSIKERVKAHYAERRNRQIALLMVAIFLQIWAFATTIPILSPLILRLRKGNVEDASLYQGILNTCNAAATFFAVPIVGALSDVYKRKPFLMFALVTHMINAIGMIIAYEVGTIEVLFVTHIISGLGAVFTAIAGAYIADLTTPETRSKYLGMIGIAFGAGFILGPGLVAATGDISYSIPLGISVALTVIDLFFVYFFLPESMDVARPRFNFKKAIPLHSFGMLRESYYTILLSIVFFLFTLGDMAQIDIYAIYGQYRFGWTVTEIGAIMVLVGVTYMLSQGVILRWIIKPFLGEEKGIILGVAAEILQALLFGFANAGWQAYPITLVRLVSLIVSPLLQGLISQRFSAERQGELMGVLRAIHTLTDVITPFTVTSIFAYYISDKVGTKVPGIIFFISAGIYVVALILALFVFSKWMPVRHVNTSLAELPIEMAEGEGTVETEIVTGRLTSPTQRRKKAESTSPTIERTPSPVTLHGSSSTAN
eukprot:TRINITY_DN21458_c0_g1_i1.p1 TRINITY_DN21458_c0_g1~~TRINITY_DN21458_c0_g1_i1.p1  ORF type:complete len:486 (-),score=149.95 TRINITY_DN21458_c0_g1_i1:45-1502(-)